MGELLFQKIFRVSYDNNSIDGTVFRHRQESAEYRSSQNTKVWGGRKQPVAVLSKGLGEAIAKILKYTNERIFIVQTNQTILLYQNDQSAYHLKVLYHPKEKIISSIYNNNTYKMAYKLPFLLIPVVIEAIQENNQVREMFKQLYSIQSTVIGMTQKEEELFFRIHDEIYFMYKTVEFTETPLLDNIPIPKEEINLLDLLFDNSKQQKTTPVTKILKFPDDSWNDNQKQFVPQLPEYINLPQEMIPLCNGIVKGDIISTLFYGPTGTGKSTLVKRICQEINLPLIAVVNCTTNLDEFILGKFVPKGKEFVFQESLVTKAIREGGAVVFEEINFARPQYLSFLYSLLDDNAFVLLDNGEIVKRHPNFRFFATMNPGYAGTTELSTALLNRFNIAVEISELNKQNIEKLLRTECSDAQIINKLLELYELLKEKIQKEDLDTAISPRNLLNCVRMLKYTNNLKEAIELAVINPISKCDSMLKEELIKFIDARW